MDLTTHRLLHTLLLREERLFLLLLREERPLRLYLLLHLLEEHLMVRRLRMEEHLPTEAEQGLLLTAEEIVEDTGEVTEEGMEEEIVVGTGEGIVEATGEEIEVGTVVEGTMVVEEGMGVEGMGEEGMEEGMGILWVSLVLG